MSKGSDWFGGKKPEPPFPEKINRRKAKRNRVKLPLRVPDGTPVDKAAYSAAYNMTSSAKGLGREECIRLGEHDFVGTQTHWYSAFSDKSRVLYICRRCGELGHSKDL